MIRPLMVTLLLAGGLTSTAQAADVYMWGVGPRLGTNFLPGAYPSAFPKIVAEDVVDGTEDDEVPTKVIEKVRGDVLFGFEAQYYVDGGSRIGLVGGFGVGRGYFDAHVIAKYNVVIQSASVDFLFGGGAGFGTQRFKQKTGDRVASLRVPYFPVRAEVAGMIRSDWLAFQLTPFFQYNIQTNHFYVDDTGAEIDVKGGFYPTVGLEFAVLFGDYSPPKPRKRR